MQTGKTAKNSILFSFFTANKSVFSVWLYNDIVITKIFGIRLYCWLYTVRVSAETVHIRKENRGSCGSYTAGL